MDKTVLSSRDSLLKWTVDVHNEVNRTNGKPVVSVEQVPDNLNKIAYSTEEKTTTVTWLTSVGFGVLFISIVLLLISMRRR